MMEEIAKFGTPTTKLFMPIGQNLTLRDGKCFMEHAITPLQQYSYTVGKNSSDSAMIIDAMDLLYSDKVDGFFALCQVIVILPVSNTFERIWDESNRIEEKHNSFMVPTVYLYQVLDGAIQKKQKTPAS
jgi:hypothetical protein